MKNLLSANGRMRRKHYWLLWLIVFGINLLTMAFVLAARDYLQIAVMISLMGSVFIIIQGVKRMHDTGHSGWFLLIPIYNLILLLTPGEYGSNRFGHDPKEGENILSGKDLSVIDTLDAPVEISEEVEKKDLRQAVIYLIIFMGVGYLQGIIYRIAAFIVTDPFEIRHYHMIFFAIEILLGIFLLSTVRLRMARIAFAFFLAIQLYYVSAMIESF